MDYSPTLVARVLHRGDMGISPGTQKIPPREEELQTPERWNLRALCGEKYQLEQALAVTGRLPQWDIAQLSTDKVKQLGMNSPNFDRVHLLWLAARCWAEGQNLELARTKPHMIGQIMDIAESIYGPTIEEKDLTTRTNSKKGSHRPSNELG